MKKVYPLKQSGFTFLEVLFVLLIICILFGVSGFYFKKGIDRNALESAASVLKSDMLLTQKNASAEGKEYMMKFLPDRYFFGPEKNLVEERKLFNGVRIVKTTFTRKNPGKDAVIFFPSLAPSTGGTITLQSALGEKKYIIISVAFGRIRMSDTPP